MLFIGLSLFSQNKALEEQLHDYMQIVREEVYAPSPDKDLYNSDSGHELLILLEEYYSDTLAKVRSKAYYLTYKCSYTSKDSALRHKSVNNLVLALKDEDSGVVGSTANWLTSFKREDFRSSSIDSLRTVLKSQTHYRDRIVMLAGFVGLQDQISYLSNKLKSGAFRSNKVIWATHLSLARMGVEEEIDFCIDLVKKQGVNDDVVYELAPDLVYTRQKKAIDYLVQILQDDTKNCYSANPENPQKIACGYRVMEFIAPVIKDFPLETDSTGDLIVDDYKEALQLARNWFDNHTADYVIIKNTY